MSRFGVNSAPADGKCVVLEDDVRITVLSDRIIRIERDGSGTFEDRATQFAVCRNFAKPQFTVIKERDKIIVTTKRVVFEVDKRSLKTACVMDGRRERARAKYNLGGTARTLDGTFGVALKNYSGRIKKEAFCLANMKGGVMARNGVAEIDDSKSFTLNADGSVEARRRGIADKYVFAFGDDYLGGLREYYELTGYQPLLPKYVLGNWWSRYYAYSERGYLDLMDKFALKNIPLTVATVDMDWHIVKNVPKDAEYKGIQGRGWTGYTFEKSLFPDHKRFLSELKRRGLAVTMNLHPRDGVRYFEEQYPEMARANGIEPSTKKTVEFDLTNPTFRDSYFDILHHPYEKEGVDFWWIDWQQGTKSKIKGLDPLWLLNHYHTMDVNRNADSGQNGVILSRYAGAGSHRYPLGFSGDTFVCWKSLKLQPYFTATASNIGYGWWSHDIGGHLYGRGRGELYARWVQYGVFSPILRLHSSNNAISKEPWLYGDKYEKIASDFLRLRHRLLPYLYSMNVKSAEQGVPLILPMYYYYKGEEAYKSRNQYMFGTEMMVCAAVEKSHNDISRVKVWFPEGVWRDFFTGKRYEGGCVKEILCPVDSYPVFVKEGGIIPMLPEKEDNSQNFSDVILHIGKGVNSFDLCDADGKITVNTRFAADNAEITVNVIKRGDFDRLNLVFDDIKGADVEVDGKPVGRRADVRISAKSCKIKLKNMVAK